MSRRDFQRELFKPHEIDSTEQSTFWLVPYGNMMTILMIFFLVMYAFATQNKIKISRVTKDIKESITHSKMLKQDIAKLGLVGELRKYIWDNKLNQFLEISSNARRIQISMQSPVLFDPGSVALKSQGKEVLKKIAELIRSETGEVRVSGHTDNTPVGAGPIENNWELSGKRAQSVVRYFTEECDLLPIRFSLIGYGEYAPIAPNDTPQHRALNRRIEVNIIKRKRLYRSAELDDIRR
ncbi:MAG: OmpA family protein [Elusimicrobia bacterium]|nr:OmpA family protein [Elusimicrobiota bacterium]MBD3411944.1 OmpA family protein [Elusimicrobiota bacterium]